MIMLDAGIGVVSLDPNAPGSARPGTHGKERLARLAAMFVGVRTRIMIPRPVLTEALVQTAEAGPADPISE